MLIGHGTFDGREAKFNLRGPDVTDLELAKWLEPVKRPVVLIDCSSASAPFLNRLSGPNRIVITATRSGSEVNYARFGHYISEAIADTARPTWTRTVRSRSWRPTCRRAIACKSTTARARNWPREHALLDDNGDRLGTPPDWFRGVRATRRAKDGAPPDGIRAHQLHLIPSDRERRIPAAVRRRRDEIEVAIAALRDQKGKLAEDEYYRRLEPLMLELGRLYRQAESEETKVEARTR